MSGVSVQSSHVVREGGKGKGYNRAWAAHAMLFGVTH